MQKLLLRTSTDVYLHQLVVTHLRRKPDTYIHLWEYYQGAEGGLFSLLQRMLDAGEIKADNLRNGLITDYSMIALAEITPLQTKASRERPSRLSLWPHRPFA
ncbi:MAG TPA: hypothetical protein VEA39_07270 [Methylophilaceae bacterium]|nr:hypothetical protein [Methylophilaceae bacterium]